ncbi:hypothetical protein EVAR_12409_1 [Eumeta japonica]|uniref:Uncharacterized protein n=1 Tax=Eumeta variegata TaxID=151549 RepID=A0A4C1TZL0_EUMVA|nr:hypothetical protein EVAR_12409_1 [Eumeta japonica]
MSESDVEVLLQKDGKMQHKPQKNFDVYGLNAVSVRVAPDSSWFKRFQSAKLLRGARREGLKACRLADAAREPDAYIVFLIEIMRVDLNPRMRVWSRSPQFTPPHAQHNSRIPVFCGGKEMAQFIGSRVRRAAPSPLRRIYNLNAERVLAAVPLERLLLFRYYTLRTRPKTSVMSSFGPGDRTLPTAKHKALHRTRNAGPCTCTRSDSTGAGAGGASVVTSVSAAAGREARRRPCIDRAHRRHGGARPRRPPAPRGPPKGAAFRTKEKKNGMFLF